MPNVSVSLKEIKKRLPKTVELLEYAGYTKKCTFKCLHCKAVYSNRTTLWLATTKTVCKCQGPQQSIPVAEFLNRLKKLKSTLRPINYRIIGGWCTFECTVCQTRFEAIPKSVELGTSNCPTCKHQDFADEYVSRLAQEFPHITLAEPYRGFRTAVKHRCTCGEEFTRKPFISKTVVRNAGCPKCDYAVGGPRLKTVEFGERVVQCQGYEDAALKYLESRPGFIPGKLSTSKAEGTPNIRYRYASKIRTYYPDFYYAPKNRLIEVKSIFTLLSVDYRKTVAKARACLKQGYEFRLILIHNKVVLNVPTGWFNLPRQKMLDSLCLLNPKLETRLRSVAVSNPFLDSQK